MATAKDFIDALEQVRDDILIALQNAGTVPKALETKEYQLRLQLARIQITEIMIQGQTLAINGRSLGRADVDVLRRQERELANLLARRARGGTRLRTVVPRV